MRSGMRRAGFSRLVAAQMNTSYSQNRLLLECDGRAQGSQEMNVCLYILAFVRLPWRVIKVKLKLASKRTYSRNIYEERVYPILAVFIGLISRRGIAVDDNLAKKSF